MRLDVPGSSRVISPSPPWRSSHRLNNYVDSTSGRTDALFKAQLRHIDKLVDLDGVSLRRLEGPAIHHDYDARSCAAGVKSCFVSTITSHTERWTSRVAYLHPRLQRRAKQRHAEMTLLFPNSSRSFDEKRNAVRFLGHEGMFEVRFFVEAEALVIAMPNWADRKSLNRSFFLPSTRCASPSMMSHGRPIRVAVAIPIR